MGIQHKYQIYNLHKKKLGLGNGHTTVLHHKYQIYNWHQQEYLIKLILVIFYICINFNCLRKYNIQ